MKIDLTGSYFVENINYLRQKYALSRSALARLVGTDSWNLELISKGKRPPVFTRLQLQRFCMVFDLIYEELIHKDLTK